MIQVPSTRAKMQIFLQNKMVQNHFIYSDEKKLEYGGGLLKTYFLEVNYKNFENTLLALEQILGSNYKLLNSDEEGFIVIQDITKSKETYYFIDNVDNRFWYIYTLAIAEDSDKFIRSLTSHINIDRAWLPMQFLEKLSKIGILRGYSGKFDNNPFVSEEDDLSKISIKLWGNLAPEVLSIFRNNQSLRQKFSLSGIRLKYSIDKFKSELFILNDLNYNGKVTSMGTSLHSHFNFVDLTFRKQYKDIIVTKIEQNLSIRFSKNILEGDPIFIMFNKIDLPISDFAKVIFSSANPFKLWGLIEVIKNDFVRVYAVDMHVGDKLTFEIFSNCIRIYLNAGACGNTIARFFTLFQQHYDSSATISGGKYDQLF